jgi:hypothetical protein
MNEKAEKVKEGRIQNEGQEAKSKVSIVLFYKSNGFD